MNLSTEQSIDSAIENFDIDEARKRRDFGTPLTIWVPSEYKKKFDLIQMRSNKQFGKLLKEVVMRSIDRVKIEPGKPA